MKLGDFQIGLEFTTAAGCFRCTDIGTRTVTAIRINAANIETTTPGTGEISTQQMDETELTKEGWFNGPPFAVSELVFDENDLPECEPILVDDPSRA